MGTAGKRKAERQPGVAGEHNTRQDQAQQRYTLGKARSVDVVGFVEARSFEINSLQRSLDDARAAGNVRAFQTLPRHLRRRAASHNVKRIPARLRERAIAEMKKSAQNSKALAGTDRLTGATKSSRYKRRRARTVREEYELRQTGKRWLETHVWHAKRMHMAEMWGTMIAKTPNERSHRAAYRAAKEKTYIHDVSYFVTLEISGVEQEIVQLLRRLTSPSELHISAKPYSGGSRMAPLTLHRAGMYPLATLGPAMALWQPQSGTGSRKLWLRTHPAIGDAVKAELAVAAETLAESGSHSLHVADITCDLVSFELLGSQSTQLLSTILSQPISPEASGSVALRLIRTLPSPATLPESVVIALRMHDPRLRFPYKIDPNNSPLLPEEHQQLQNLLLRWPTDAATLENPLDHGIWDRAACAASLEKRPSEHALNERRRQQLIPGTKLEPNPSTDITVPLLLVRTGPEAQLGSRVIQTDRKYIDTLAHGWTLIAPKGWGMPLWMAFNFAGARAQGMDERLHIALEAGLPMFPADWPGTLAYDKWTGAAATEARQKWVRRPPGKRTNYLKFGTESPFYPPFHKLLDIYDIPDAYPSTTSDSLECRKRCLQKIASKRQAARVDANAAKDTSDCAMTVDKHASTQATETLASNTESKDSTSSIWLVSGERLEMLVASLLVSTRFSKDDLTPCPTFQSWAEPLLNSVISDCNTEPHSKDGMDLIERCLIRVRLVCVGRGTMANNAPICIRASDTHSSQDDAIGYVMRSSFSLARGCGMGVGACSLRGLFKLWMSVTLPASQHGNKSYRVSVRSISGGPDVHALLNLLP
ncbi:Ribonucleases P/MRP protein subunit pop1 [Coemansia sp. RSA 1365]|nr:Ribonucleases P/MRP protein subunit pop1 [Coemansia sp. RSA 1365]